MSNKTECPVCQSYSSSITDGLLNDRKCPVCGTSDQSIQEMKKIEKKKNYYKCHKVQQDLINENAELKKELIIKRDRYFHLKETVWNMKCAMENMQKDLYDLWLNRIEEWEKEA